MLNWAMSALLRLGLLGDLLDLKDHELRRLERRESDHDVDDALVDVGLGGGLAAALDEERVARRRALERPLLEERLHERADVEADLGPERLVVGLEDDPLRAAEEALLDVEGQATDGDVFP